MSTKLRGRIVFAMLGIAMPSYAIAAIGDSPADKLAYQPETSVRTYEVAPTPEPDGEIRFNSVTELDQRPGQVDFELRGGREARTENWRASLYSTYVSRGRQYSCTAALVGPRAVLTAAHCVPRSGLISFDFNGSPYNADCVRHPEYVADIDDSADFALCAVRRNVDQPDDFQFETINLSPMNQIVGRWITLTGFGCTSDIVANDAITGKYWVGDNQAESSSEDPEMPRGAEFYAGSEDNNLFTIDDPDLANLCPGDSGGPAFLSVGGVRTIIGVNSRVFYADESRTTYADSLISATGGPEFIDWAIAWALGSEAEVPVGGVPVRTGPPIDVCGIRATVSNCRL